MASCSSCGREIETWRPITGHPGYSVSLFGRVRRDQTGRILKPWPTRVGYLLVQLDRRYHALVAGLVAEAFLGQRPAKHQVNHQDGDKSHNAAHNLEWMTPSQNRRHAFATGLSEPPYTRGERQGAAKLKEEDVREIRRLGLLGETHRAIAAQFSLDYGNVGRIIRRERWQHVI